MKNWFVVTGMLLALSVQGQSYSFESDVSGQGNPMVFIPGLASDGAVWDETVAQFSKTHACHVVTLPGFAGQVAIETDRFLETIGDELIQYIRNEKLEKPVIVGHSLGGFLTLYIGSKAPDLASQLVVVDGLPFLAAIQNPMLTEESAVEFAQSMRTRLESQTPESYEATQPLLLKTMITSDEDIEVAMEWGRKSDPATVAQAMFELYSIDLRDDLANIKAPTLVLGAWYGYQQYGATKESTRQLYDLQFQQHPNYRLVLSEKGKHFLMWDDLDFVVTEIKAFLNE